MQDYWDKYWESGHTTSFGNELLSNYQGEIKTFWNNALSKTVNQARVLDLCTGNGALPRLFLNKYPNLKITAADLASIDEQSLKMAVKKSFPNSDVEFKARVDCTKLPFGKESFDLVTSQFGIEYSDIPKTLNEVFTVLKPSGIAIFLMHVDESRFIRQNKMTLEFLRTLIKSDFFVLIENAANKGVTELETKTFINKLIESSEIIKEQNVGEFESLKIDSFMHVLPYQASIGNAKRLCEMFQTEVNNYMSRLLDLIKASRSNEELSKLKEGATELGFSILQSTQIVEHGEVLGHSCMFKKI